MQQENLSSLMLVKEVRKIHGYGWESMPTRGGLDQITMTTGSQQLLSLTTMLTLVNMHVRTQFIP